MTTILPRIRFSVKQRLANNLRRCREEARNDQSESLPGAGTGTGCASGRQNGGNGGA